MITEGSRPIPEDQIPDALTSDRITGIGATVLTIGAASLVNYGISLLIDYSDGRVDDPSVSVPLIGSVMLMWAGRRLMKFADERRMLANNVTVVNAINTGNVDPARVEIKVEQ